MSETKNSKRQAASQGRMFAMPAVTVSASVKCCHATTPTIARPARIAPERSSSRISPGDEFEVIEKQPFDGPLFVRFGDDVHVLGGALAEAMRVELTI